MREKYKAELGEGSTSIRSPFLPFLLFSRYTSLKSFACQSRVLIENALRICTSCRQKTPGLLAADCSYLCKFDKLNLGERTLSLVN